MLLLCFEYSLGGCFFQDILRGLVPEKTSIADAMVWCAEHASCAKEISQCLLESLGLSETPLHKKVLVLSLLLFATIFYSMKNVSVSFFLATFVLVFNHRS